MPCRAVSTQASQPTKRSLAAKAAKPPGTTTTGGDATVRVKRSAFTVDVPFRVWIPEKFELAASETTLNKITRADGTVVLDPAHDAGCFECVWASALHQGSLVARV